MSIISKFNKSVNENKGRSLSLPAQGRAGARATSSLRNAKFGGGGKAKAGKNSFPPTPFLFARPSENYQKSASGFSRKKVRILTKRYRTGNNSYAIIIVILIMGISADFYFTTNFNPSPLVIFWINERVGFILPVSKRARADWVMPIFLASFRWEKPFLERAKASLRII